MTQQDPAKIVRENIEAFSAGYWKRFANTLTPDTVYDEIGT